MTKVKPQSAPPSLLSLVIRRGTATLRGQGRWVVIAAAACAAVVVGGYAVWEHVRPQVVQGPHYRLTAEQVAITPQPAWIKSDIRAQALRDANLSQGTSILERDLAQRIAKAFALHPWVAEVKRVTKHTPARVEVELIYRRPVCMVEVPGGLYPVDAKGVLLPSADFTSQEALGYPRLSSVVPVTEGPVGTPWSDARVIGAAALAAELVDLWKKLELERIVAVSTGSSDAHIEYEVVGRQGLRILWGSAPRNEKTGEPVAREKRNRLESVLADVPAAEKTGAVKRLHGESILDLRGSARAAGAPHTASRP